MRTKYILVVVVLLVAFGGQPVAWAGEPDITGTFEVEGANPDGAGKYKGTLMIEKTGDAFNIEWNVGMAYLGTGILMDGYLAVAYTDDKRTWFGIVVYKVGKDGETLEGKWTGAGGKTLGVEKATRRGSGTSI